METFMITKCRPVTLWVIVWILTTVAVHGAALSNVELVCVVDSVLTTNPNDSIVVPIYLTNITDSVAAFQLWIQSAYPEFIRFSADSSSSQVRARIDMTGSRCSDCGITSRILDSMNGLALITAFSSTPIPPGSGLLLKVILETNGTVPDSACVNSELYLNPYQSSFSNPQAEGIGCDYDSLGHCTMNFSKRVLISGRVVIGTDPGDADGNCNINISDAVYLIAYIFADGPAPWPLLDGDANCDQAVNISDGVYLISYIFSGGPAPCVSPR
jgi:hypothetical protein